MNRRIKFAQVAVLVSGIVMLITPRFLGLGRLAIKFHSFVANRVERFRYKLYHELDNKHAAFTLQCAVEATNYYSPAVPENPNGTWDANVLNVHAA